MLKQNVYKSARKFCGYDNKRLMNGVKESLRHVPISEQEKNKPQPQYLDALTKAYCSTRNFRTAMQMTSAINFKDDALNDSTGIESTEADPSSAEDSDDYSNYSENQVETQGSSYSARDILVFIFGSVIGFIICHYIFLLKIYPSNSTPKVLRRPEL